MPGASSNKRHLRDRTFCHPVACRKDTCHQIVKQWCRGINICRVGGVVHNVVEGKTLYNVFLTFKISVIQVLLQLQNGSRNFIKYWVYHKLILTKPSCLNFVTAITNADVTSAIKTSTLGTLNKDLNLQSREEKCFC